MIQPVKEKIILGIDPGTTIMGYGVLRVCGTRPEMIAMGIIDLRKFGNHYLKLRHIHERVLSIIESYLPDELAIEAPFFGKNVQSMLKLGRIGYYSPTKTQSNPTGKSANHPVIWKKQNVIRAVPRTPAGF